MRIMVFDHRESYLFDISPRSVSACTEVEEVNGEHYLSITATQRLQQGQRLVIQKDTGQWREYVVLGIDELHDSGRSASGTYYAVWSPQYDLSCVYAEDIEVGGERDAPAQVAMERALDGTSRWQAGRVDGLGAHTMEMFGNSAWERVCDVANTYGGELDWEIEVGFANSVRISSRKLHLVRQLGSQKVTRRFDWGHDTASIRRKPQEVPNCCRIIPVGNGEDVTLDGLVLEGKVEQRYLEDEEAALAFRYPDGNGGWEYPTRKVKFDIDSDYELLDYAAEHLREYTRPTPTYEASVIQYAVAGMDVAGVGLGDVVHVVDRGFNPDSALRVEGRVMKVTSNLLDPTDMQLTIGQLGSGLGDLFKRMQADMKSIQSGLNHVTGGATTTAEYLDWLFEQLNGEINATGGWTYIVPGEGILTYDKEVADPLTGMGVDGKHANQVVQVKGGTIRLANSRKSGVAGIDGWNWRTVLESGHIAADMVTAGQITTGYIGTPSGNYWDLETGELRMASGFVKVDGDPIVTADSVGQIASAAAANATDDLNKILDQREIFNRLTNNDANQGIFIDDGRLYLNADYIKTGTIVTDRIVSPDSPSDFAKIGVTSFGSTGASFYTGTANYLDICRLANKYTVEKGGIGFATHGYRFLDAFIQEAYTDGALSNPEIRSISIYPPASGAGDNAPADVDSSMIEIIANKTAMYDQLDIKSRGSIRMYAAHSRIDIVTESHPIVISSSGGNTEIDSGRGTLKLRTESQLHLDCGSLFLHPSEASRSLFVYSKDGNVNYAAITDTLSKKVITGIRQDSSGVISYDWDTLSLRFVNGILVSASGFE